MKEFFNNDDKTFLDDKVVQKADANELEVDEMRYRNRCLWDFDRHEINKDSKDQVMKMQNLLFF